MNVILYFILVILAVILARTLMFKPINRQKEDVEEIQFDKDAAINALGELVKCKTVSRYNTDEEDNAEFEKLIGKLPVLYPNVFEKCTLTKFPDRGLLFKWAGKEEGPSAVLMAHYDVVPVDEENWSKPAFEAIIEDGYMWGRGTLDTKSSFNGIMSAANTLIGQGFQPKNDIYFAFSGGEEVNGNGAVNIVNYFRENNVELSMVLDEGGAVVDNVFPGVSQRCGLVGIAEKGMMNLTYSINSDGGHASAPSAHTPVGRLALACSKLEAHPFKAHFTKPVNEMFDTLGRYSNFLYRLIFANLWLFKPILDSISKKSGGEINAMIRTTVAFTQMEGSDAPNVIPPSASMVSNIRLNPEDSIASAIDYIKKTINDDDIKLEVTSSMEPSPISSTDCEGWERIKDAVEATWKCIVSPYLMVQCSDSRHYSEISDRVYKFSAMDLTAEERHSIHGNNEKIRLETICSAVEFFIRLMKSC